MPVYRPGILASLQIVFDEGFGTPAGNDTDSPAVTAAQVGLRLGSQVPGVTAFVLQPTELDLTKKSYRFPDELKLKIAYLDAPFPADSIRAANVLIHMDNIQAVPTSAQDFGGQRLTPTEDNTRFAGVVDEWDEKINPGHICIECRSYTGLLLDKDAVDDATGKPLAIDTSQPLDVAIDNLISNYAAVAGHMKVQYLDDAGTYWDVGTFDLPTPGNSKPKAHGSKKTQHATGPGAKYWALISEACIAAGYICFVRLDKLVISTARNVLDPQTATAPLMLYGQNLKTLGFKKKMGKVKSRVVQVFAYCPDLRKTLMSQFPQPGTALYKRIAGAAAPLDPLAQVDPTFKQAATVDVLRQDIPPQGGANLQSIQELLEIVAENAYYAVAKNTVTGVLSTKDSWSLTGDVLDPDLYDLWPGQPIEVGIRPLTAGETNGPPASFFAGMSVEAIANYLVNVRNFSSQSVAQELAQHIKSGARNKVFRTKAINYHYDNKEGLEIQVEFSDYIQAHDDPARNVKTGAKQIQGG